MKRFVRTGGTFTLMLFAALGAVRASERAASGPPGAGAEFFDPADVRSGMQATARTVFAGSESKDFVVELLGVIQGNRPKGDLILFRALGDTLALTGIVAGMSGSPVYVEGKLLGAIAFAYPFSKQAIGMITPIREMMEGFSRVNEPPAPWMGAPGVLYDPLRRAFLSYRFDGDLWEGLGPEQRREGEGTPLISLCASGWAPEIQPSIDGFARRSGLPAPITGAGSHAGPRAVAGGGSAAAPGPAGTPRAGTAADGTAAPNDAAGGIKAGSAVGVILIDGDASLAAIGTVTYRDGDRLVAFGHPLFHAGPVQLPMTEAWIHAIVPSYNSSFKMGSVGSIVGTVRQDLRAGITGVLGETPPMLPVRIELSGPSGTEKYHYRVARGILLEPSLIGWAVSNSFLQHGWRTGDASADAHITIHYNGSRTLSRRDRISTQAPSTEIAEQLLEPVPLLLTNPFERVVIDSVDLEVSYRPELKEAILIDLWAERANVRPGETLSLTARLKNRHGEMHELPVEISVPERWRGQTLLILAGGAKDLTDWDQERAPALYEPKDLTALERMLREMPDQGDILVRVYSEDEGVILGDRELGRLPGTVASVLGAGHKRGPARSASNFRLEERRIDAGGVVSGGLAVRVRVE